MRQRLITILGLAACAVAALPAVAEAKPPHVVFLLFDELPIDSLRTPDGSIDADRFPGFAALARTSTWFPNAHTIYDSTHHAVPAILDGRLPRAQVRPTAKAHPRNVFDVFGRRGWEVRAIEPATYLCRRRWCPRGTPRTARDVLRSLDSNRAAQLRRALRAIKPKRKPTFWFRHVLLPHFPWVYLPSGKRYPVPRRDHGALFVSWRSLYDHFLIAQARQRHLLQLGFVDLELRRLIRRLRRNRMWDRTLFVITADHGIVFEAGVPDRRRMRPRTIDEVAPVPLFVKAPGQDEGEVDEALVRTLDVVPTMADVLGLRLGWSRRAGRSGFSAEVRARDAIRVLTRDLSRWLTLDLAELERRRQANLKRFARDFGRGVFAIGPNPELIGRRVGALATTAGGALGARFRSPGRRVRGRSRRGQLPARVTGTILRGRSGSVRDLALSVNGRIAAVGRSVRLVGDRKERFSILFPPSRLRRGVNRLRLFEVAEVGGELRLRALR